MPHKNKYQLTKKQHFHQNYIIKGFINDDKQVEVMFSNGLKECHKTDSKIFLADWLWDHGTESMNLSHRIETPMNHVVGNALYGNCNINSRDHLTITRYLCLWRARFNVARTPFKSQNQESYPYTTVSKDTAERMEKMGVPSSVDEVSHNRNQNGAIVKAIYLRELENFRNKDHLKWVLLKSGATDFLSSDCYFGMCIVPISPSLVFVLSTEKNDRELSMEEAKLVNQCSFNERQNFVFGKNLDNCKF